MNSKSQILTYNNISFDNFDFDNEKIHCTPTKSMIHEFLNAQKIMDYENIIYYIAPSQNFCPLFLFKYQHSKELIFQHYFKGNVNKFLNIFNINK